MLELMVSSGALRRFVNCLEDPNDLIYEEARAFFAQFKEVSYEARLAAGIAHVWKALLLSPKLSTKRLTETISSLGECFEANPSVAADFAPAISSVILRHTLPQEIRLEALWLCRHLEPMGMGVVLIQNGCFADYARTCCDAGPSTSIRRLFYLAGTLIAEERRNFLGGDVSTLLAILTPGLVRVGADCVHGRDHESLPLLSPESYAPLVEVVSSFASVGQIISCATKLVQANFAFVSGNDEELFTLRRVLIQVDLYSALLKCVNSLCNTAPEACKSALCLLAQMIPPPPSLVLMDKAVIGEVFSTTLKIVLQSTDFCAAAFEVWGALLLHDEVAPLADEHGAESFLLSCLKDTSEETKLKAAAALGSYYRQRKNVVPDPALLIQFVQIISAKLGSVERVVGYLQLLDSLLPSVALENLDEETRSQLTKKDFFLLSLTRIATSPFAGLTSVAVASARASCFALFSFYLSHFRATTITAENTPALEDFLLAYLDIYFVHMAMMDEALFEQAARWFLEWTLLDLPFNWMQNWLPRLRYMVRYNTKFFLNPNQPLAPRHRGFLFFLRACRLGFQKISPIGNGALNDFSEPLEWMERMSERIYPYKFESYLASRSEKFDIVSSSSSSSSSPAPEVDLFSCSLDPLIPDAQISQHYNHAHFFELLRILGSFALPNPAPVSLTNLFRTLNRGLKTYFQPSPQLAAAIMESLLSLLSRQMLKHQDATELGDSLQILLMTSEVPAEYLPAIQFYAMKRSLSYSFLIGQPFYADKIAKAVARASVSCEDAIAICRLFLSVPIDIGVLPHIETLLEEKIKRFRENILLAPVYELLHQRRLAIIAMHQERQIFANARDMLAATDFSFLEESREGSDEESSSSSDVLLPARYRGSYQNLSPERLALLAQIAAPPVAVSPQPATGAALLDDDTDSASSGSGSNSPD